MMKIIISILISLVCIINCQCQITGEISDSNQYKISKDYITSHIYGLDKKSADSLFSNLVIISENTIIIDNKLYSRSSIYEEYSIDSFEIMYNVSLPFSGKEISLWEFDTSEPDPFIRAFGVYNNKLELEYIYTLGYFINVINDNNNRFLSYPGSLTQEIGLTNFTIEYSRTIKNDKDVFGTMTAYDKLWQISNNSNVRVSFSDSIEINGISFNAGTYNAFIIPNENEWEILFSKEVESFSFKENSNFSDVIKTSSKLISNCSPVETLTISLKDITDSSAGLEFSWDSTSVTFPIYVNTQKKVLENIETVLKGHPTHEDYFNAANYYFTAGKDLKQALEWMNKAIDENDMKFWQVKRKSEILGALGMKKEAIEAAKLSLELATKAGNNDYIKMNNYNIKKWSM